MIPIRLELKNFLAYRSPDPLRFEGIHLACLTGANGAGKSSILDAITWALWGKARSGPADLVHTGQTEMAVRLEFLHEGTTYSAHRRTSRKKTGSAATTLDFHSWLDDEQRWNLLNEGSIKQTQDKIDHMLRLTYEIFIHSAFLQQGKADAFATMKPGERKQVLSNILGLELWTVYESAAKAEVKTLEDNLRTLEGSLREIEDELKQEPALRADLEEANQAQSAAQEQLNAALLELAKVADASTRMDAAQTRKADLERQQRERQRDATALEGDIRRQQTHIARYETTIADKDNIEQGYQALQAARQADAALGEKLIRLRDFDDTRAELTAQISSARAELEADLSASAATITELESTANDADEDQLQRIQADLFDLERIERQRDECREQVESLKTEQAACDSTNKALRDEMNQIKDRLDRLRDVDGGNCPLCGQPLGAQHRDELIAQVETEGRARGDIHRANAARVKAIAAALVELQNQVNGFTARLKEQDGLRKQVGALQGQIERAHGAQQRIGEVQARQDALQTALTAQDYAHEARAQLAALEAEREAIGYDRATHDHTRAQLDTLRQFDKRQQELANALDTLPGLHESLRLFEERRERLLKTMAEELLTLEALSGEIERIRVDVDEQRRRQIEVNGLRTAERAQHGRVMAAQQKLKTLDDLRLRKQRLEERRDHSRRQAALYDELRAAFGKNGVPAMIIESAIPELEAAANTLLARMTDGRMALMFTTQREKVAGGVIETLDIQIADELGTRTYELYSGGEAFRINFAVRVALSQLLARRAGAHLRTLFIDEGFGTQDDDGRNKLVEAITAIQDEFDLILVITHIEDLRDSFPVHIQVEKTPTGSRVMVR
jgi:exonuclease SbcC